MIVTMVFSLRECLHFNPAVGVILWQILALT